MGGYLSTDATVTNVVHPTTDVNTKTDTSPTIETQPTEAVTESVSSKVAETSTPHTPISNPVLKSSDVAPDSMVCDNYIEQPGTKVEVVPVAVAEAVDVVKKTKKNRNKNKNKD